MDNRIHHHYCLANLTFYASLHYNASSKSHYNLGGAYAHICSRYRHSFKPSSTQNTVDKRLTTGQLSQPLLLHCHTLTYKTVSSMASLYSTRTNNTQTQPASTNLISNFLKLYMVQSRYNISLEFNVHLYDSHLVASSSPSP